MRAVGRCLLERPWLALILALIVETVVFVAGQDDFAASDPLWYAEIAHRLAHHPSEVFATHDTHPFVMRLGLTVPLALLYRLFGVSTLVTNLPTLGAALGILLVAYAAAPTPRAKLLGMLFGITCTQLIRHASILNVDLPCAALMACTVLCLSRRDRPRGPWWLVGAAVAWVAAFLVKETALWCGVVWLYAVVVDLRAAGATAAGVRTVARAYASATAVLAALAAGYAVLCAELWGSPWARFQGIQELTYGHAWTLHGQPTSHWVQRLTWQPPVLLATMFQAALVPAVLAAWLVRGRERIWWVATAAFGLLYWLGSTSLSSYSPLPLAPRMALPVLPGIVVLAALVSDRALDRLEGSRWRAPLAAVLLVALAVPSVRVMASALVRKAPETAAFRALREEVSASNQRFVLVCGEPRCVDISGFYFGLEPPPNLTVVFATHFASAPRPMGAVVRALVNSGRASVVRSSDPRLDRTEPIVALALRPIVWHPRLRLYDAGDGARLWEALRAVP